MWNGGWRDARRMTGRLARRATNRLMYRILGLGTDELSRLLLLLLPLLLMN